MFGLKKPRLGGEPRFGVKKLLFWGGEGEAQLGEGKINFGGKNARFGEKRLFKEKKVILLVKSLIFIEIALFLGKKKA